MKLIILAFIISISIHLILFNNYKQEEILKNNHNKKEKTIKKSDIKYVKIKKQEEKKHIKKSKELIKEIKKSPKKAVKRIAKPKVKKTIQSKKKTKNKKIKKIKKAKEFQKKVLKEQIVKNKPTIQEKTLENFLMQKDPVDKKMLSYLRRLYGREYESFTKVQKAFLEKNLNNFQIITQRVLDRLGYPPIAAKMRVGGTNVVEFLFHPDGSISNLRISSSSQYNVLDSYTLELIEIAYKDYPKPKTATKLKFNVFYKLY